MVCAVVPGGVVVGGRDRVCQAAGDKRGAYCVALTNPSGEPGAVDAPACAARPSGTRSEGAADTPLAAESNHLV